MSIRIALADDHAVFRSGLRALLEKEGGFEIAGEAGNGFDAIRLIEESRVDVLLLDVSLPGLPGPRVAEAVLGRKPDLPIVVLTMHEDEYYVQELFRIGVRGYVLKKSTGSDLIQAIRRVVNGQTYVDPAVAGHVVSGYVGRREEVGSRLGMLSQREREVCGLLALGHTNAEIGEQLAISERTVETHRANIMSKLELKTRAELVRFAIDNGLVRL